MSVGVPSVRFIVFRGVFIQRFIDTLSQDNRFEPSEFGLHPFHSDTTEGITIEFVPRPDFTFVAESTTTREVKRDGTNAPRLQINYTVRMKPGRVIKTQWLTCSEDEGFRLV